MGKRTRTRRVLPNGRDAVEQYFTMGYRTAQSVAWRSLSGPAIKVWVELRTRFNGGNNGRLHLSLEEGAHLLGLGKSTVARALAELEEKGFIKKTLQGQFYGRMASEYALTDKPVNGHMPTCDWKRWRPPEKRLPTAQKQKRGSKTGHNGRPTGSDTGPARCNGSTSEPVRAVVGVVIGSETERL